MEYPRKVHIPEDIKAKARWLNKRPVVSRPLDREQFLAGVWRGYPQIIPVKLSKEDALFIVSQTVPGVNESNITEKEVETRFLVPFVPAITLFKACLDQEISIYAFSKFHEDVILQLSPEEEKAFLILAEEELNSHPGVTEENKEQFHAIIEGGERLISLLEKIIPGPIDDRSSRVPIHVLLQLPSEEHFIRFSPATYRWGTHLSATVEYMVARGWREPIEFEERYNCHQILNVEAPEMAALAIDRMNGDPTLSGYGRAWFVKYPLCAVVGLVPLAMGGIRTADATHVLRLLFKKGIAFPEALPYLPPAQVAWLEALISAWNGPTISVSELDQPLKNLLAKAPAWKRSEFFDPELSTPLMIDGKSLHLDGVCKVLAELRKTPIEENSALLQEIKRRGEPKALDMFLNGLFRQWRDAEVTSTYGDGVVEDTCPPKEKWALAACGHLGTDLCVPRLVKFILHFQQVHPRAKHGMACLAAIGTTAAAKGLFHLTKKSFYPSIRKQAKEFYDKIGHLAVPGCGLDERGGRDFDYGPRQFRMLIDNQLRPVIKHEGTVLTSLPAPSKGDDRKKVAEAKKDWKACTQEFKNAAKAQGEYLERCLVKSHRWTRAEFLQLFTQPLMRALGQTLLFSVYADQETATHTFQLLQDGTYLNIEDTTIPFPDGDCFGLTHPVYLTDEELNKWRVLQSEYSMIPLFKQLSRRFFRRPMAALECTEFTEFSGLPVSEKAQMMLSSMGYDSRVEIGFIKHFPDYNTTAVAQLPTEVFFHHGRVIIPKATQFQAPPRLNLKAVHPVLFSEVLRNVGAVVDERLTE